MRIIGTPITPQLTPPLNANPRYTGGRLGFAGQRKSGTSYRLGPHDVRAMSAISEPSASKVQRYKNAIAAYDAHLDTTGFGFIEAGTQVTGPIADLDPNTSTLPGEVLIKHMSDDEIEMHLRCLVDPQQSPEDGPEGNPPFRYFRDAHHGGVVGTVPLRGATAGQRATTSTRTTTAAATDWLFHHVMRLEPGVMAEVFVPFQHVANRALIEDALNNLADLPDEVDDL